MRKLLILLLIITVVPVARAQNYLDIRKYANSYEIRALSGKESDRERNMAKCQAVRLNKEWFLTAAHCLQGPCAKGCSIQARLIVHKDYELDMQAEHTSVMDSPFIIYSKASAAKNAVSYDLALIRFDPAKTKYIHLDKRLKYILTKEQFLEKLSFRPGEYDRAIDGSDFPTLLLLEAKTPKLLNRALAVPSIWGDDNHSEILGSRGYVYYSPEKQYLYTNNFGIRQGISGSGVFTSEGELVGIVSSVGSFHRQSSAPLPEACLGTNYTFLSVFDSDVVHFITKNAGRVNTKKSTMKDLKVIPQECRDVAFAIEGTID
jgi:hypothetical protein